MGLEAGLRLGSWAYLRGLPLPLELRGLLRLLLLLRRLLLPELRRL